MVASAPGKSDRPDRDCAASARARSRAKRKRCWTASSKRVAAARSPGRGWSRSRLPHCAEALALRSRFKEADQLYRQAIDLIDDPTDPAVLVVQPG